MGLEFEHRPSDSPWIERVWRSRSSGGTASMTSIARAHWDLVVWEDADGRHAGIQGPESRASVAPVPRGATFLGVRIALGAVLAGRPASTFVDRFVPLPLVGGRVEVAGDRLNLPTYADAERFVDLLVRRGSLIGADLRPGAMVSERTRQRRSLSAVGLPQRTVRQIERAAEAAVRLQAGEPAAEVAQAAGYFDQPHLARSLRRFIGPSATELAAPADDAPLSLLYKTRAEAGR